MRIWLNPQKIAERNMNPDEVVGAIRKQNIQVAAGVVGGPPYKDNVEIQLPVNVQGRLADVDQFENIIVKREGGVVTYLRDVARVEMGASEYALRALLDNQQALALVIFQTPGANAIDISNNVRAKMAELNKHFPDGLEYRIAYDPTTFVRDSIKAVIHTLLEAIVLVVLVVIVFLQTWRAAIIPLLAVPVSVVGTFAVMLGFGFSINALSLFGLVLAIGIVVDDAIVVVENVERNIATGLRPREATIKAMKEVTGPIIAIALVLCAVFVPIAFISGLTGQFYRQFALTIAISTVISAFNSLTLSPALSALLLRSHDAPKDRLTQLMDRWLGGFFSRFNRLFSRGGEYYGGGVKRALQHKRGSMVLYAALLAATVLGFVRVPAGFVPIQDKGYLVNLVRLPEGATLDRTESVVSQMVDVALEAPGVRTAVQLPGLSINGFINSPSSAVVFVGEQSFEELHKQGTTGPAMAASLQKQFASIRDAFIAVFPPPPVQGLGNTGGFKLQIEDRGDAGYLALSKVVNNVLEKARKAPELAGVYTNYNVSTPQLYADVDRTRAAQLGVDVDDVFKTMQIYLGSLYVNDFNKFGRTYQLIAQGDKDFRSKRDDILGLKVRNVEGRMVPLGAVVTLSDTSGPDSASRYNAYRSADINGRAAPGYSTGQAQAAITRILNDTLPGDMAFEWTELAYQQILAGNTALIVFPICILLVFLVLTAQYESPFVPLAIILIVPMCLFSAIAGVWLTGGENNLFTQIGFFVIGLACKNAILICEFARELEMQGKGTLAAAIEAAHLRLRPILMTSIAFIMGVLPLVLSHGAGAEMRHAMGVAVFFGMIGVTFFGLFLTPVFYVLSRNLEKRITRKEKVQQHVEA